MKDFEGRRNIPQSTIKVVTKGTKKSFHIHHINNSISNKILIIRIHLQSLFSYIQKYILFSVVLYCYEVSLDIISSDSLEIHQNHRNIRLVHSVENITFFVGAGGCRGCKRLLRWVINSRSEKGYIQTAHNLLFRLEKQQGALAKRKFKGIILTSEGIIKF